MNQPQSFEKPHKDIRSSTMTAMTANDKVETPKVAANKFKDMLKQEDADGQFRRQSAQFRGWISPGSDKNARFPAEAGRYVLYLNYGCPWAHRTNIVRSLKGLENIIEVAVMGFELTKDGWVFNGQDGSLEKDPLYGFKYIRDLYHKADPSYNLRFTVPMLWDRKQETIVNNESSEIIRMFYSAFDDLLPTQLREHSKPNGGLIPVQLKAEIETMNEWVYDQVNNGVYKTGFATTQQAYEEHLVPLFEGLDRLEAHLSQPEHQPYLFGKEITEADVRLFPTLIRFDTAYHTTFLCNLKMVRQDYPQLHAWLRRLYWDTSERTNGGAFQKTTRFDCFKKGYAVTRGMSVVPMGPLPHIEAL